MVTSMRKIRSIIYVALVATAGLLAATMSPLAVLSASIIMIVFFAFARQMNFYKIFMMMKGWTKNVSRIRFEIRAKVRTGFRDYTDSAESESSRQSGRCGYAR